MPSPRKYDVLVDGECVYTGLLRTAEIVFDSCTKAVKLQHDSQDSPLVSVVLAIHFEGGVLIV